ncbi:MAG: type II toxin-antitoxin system prevent-host-death family antitoxin [Terricaulis sp.]
MAKPWTVQDAKAQLSELLRRARTGAPQRIGVTDDTCVLVSAKQWEALQPSHLGAWLVETAPRGDELELPTRKSHRRDPFAGDKRG